MESTQRALRYPYNKVQGPPTIVGWTKVVSTTPAWGIEPTTSSLGAMSPNHQAKPVVPEPLLHMHKFTQEQKLGRNVEWKMNWSYTPIIHVPMIPFPHIQELFPLLKIIIIMSLTHHTCEIRMHHN